MLQSYMGASDLTAPDVRFLGVPHGFTTLDENVFVPLDCLTSRKDIPLPTQLV